MNLELSGDSFQIEPTDKQARLSMRGMIESFVSEFRKEIGSERGDMDKINENGLVEHFVGGAYIRQLFIPAGHAIVSQLWNKDRFWIIVSGKVTITSEAGRETITAPYYGLAPFGSRVALYTHEDTLWFAITGAKSDNSEDVEKEIIVEDYSALSYPWDKIEGGVK